MKIKHFSIHRKEQWDVSNLKPLICIHKTYNGGDAVKRIFYLGFKKWRLLFKLENPFKYRF